MGHGNKLSRKKEQAIIALLEEPTVRDAAERVKVSPNTLYKWMALSDFDQAYRQARHEAMGVAIARLQQASSEAVRTLEEVMADTEATPASRVTAARAVLDLALKATEIEQIEERLAQLERKVELHAKQKAG
jgi:transposase-like protein